MLVALLLAVSTHAQTTSASRFITVNGVKLHYLEWSNPAKPPLILLHGIGRDAHSFDHIAPHFAADYRVIAMDLRGHGDSGWHPDGAYLVDDFVRDLEGLVGQLQLRDLIVLGNSTGGRVAQVYAGRHPDRVRALVVEDVGPERPKDIAAGFARRVQEEANGWTSEDELVAHLRRQSSSVSDDLLRAHVRSATKRRDDGRLVWKRDPKLVNGFVPTELWQDVRRISSPTLYVLGGNSAIVAKETQEQLARTIPKVEIVVMPGIGHYPHLEAPADYVRLIKDFLSRRLR
jgi:pimeloyl-ACP methyl ester carboxylesterase